MAVAATRPDCLRVKLSLFFCKRKHIHIANSVHYRHWHRSIKVLTSSRSFSEWSCTFRQLPHCFHVSRKIFSDQGHQSMVVLQLVDKVMAVKDMRTSLGLTEKQN